MADKIHFYSAIDPPPVVPLPTGDGREKNYVLDPEKNEVVAEGYTDFQSMIQAAGDSCDFKKILAKYRQTGDVTLLKVRRELNGDFTSAPETPMQASLAEKALMNLYNEEFAGEYPTFSDFLAAYWKGGSDEKEHAPVSPPAASDAEKNPA